MIKDEYFSKLSLSLVLCGDPFPRADALHTDEYLCIYRSIMTTANIAIECHESLERLSSVIVQWNATDSTGATIRVDHDVV